MLTRLHNHVRRFVRQQRGAALTASSSAASGGGGGGGGGNVPVLSPVEIIVKKREGLALSREDINTFIDGYNCGDIPDYQASAFLMATYLKGMTNAETADMTLAMAHSGHIADMSHLPGAKVDKHSTGGVGDKISLALAPLIASCGHVVPMMSGRGLGHTGGTLDKLESIPGFSASLSKEDFMGTLERVGASIIAPTSDMAPVDKKLYALRDVTGTTESLPLICSSIMSKKIAEGPDSLILDVKTGRGAFLKEWDQSIALAEAMVAAGTNAGINTVAVLTNMDQPLGNTVGNWMETEEAIHVMQGRGPEDMTELTVVLAAHMLLATGKVATYDAAEQQARANLANGAALEKFAEIVEAQGGDPSYVHDPSKAPSANCTADVIAESAGFVTGIDALEIGLTGCALGAGRQMVTDVIDYTAGIHLHKKVGDPVAVGEPLATLHGASDELLERTLGRTSAAFEIGEQQPQLPGLVSHVLTHGGGLVDFDDWKRGYA